MSDLSIKLIEGHFLPNEARKVLSSVINSKINYHKIELLSEHVRNGFENSNSRKRVDYLNNANEEVINLVQKAIESGQKFELSADINIKFID